jgi:hypothetical protein
MDYEPFKSMSDVEYLFRTGRGSTYAHLPGSQTIRNRSGANHTDTTTGVQPKSTKTLYMDPKAVNSVGSWLQDPTTATRLVPEVGKDGKPTGYALVQATEDFYRPASKYAPEMKLVKGQTVSRVPFTLEPKQGLHPVEILGSSDSPKGTKARNVHFGNAITEVFPKTAGKAGIAASLLGAASAAKAGQYGEATDKLTDLAVLPFAESRGTNEGHNEELARRRLMAPTIDRASGGTIKMPDEYSKGNWKLI